jgi:hypothetical protein
MRFALLLFACFTRWRLSSASSEWLAPHPLFDARQDSYSSFQQQQQEQPHAAADGSLDAVTHAQQYQQQRVPPAFEDLEINLEHVSLSLRLTCEMNRRLLQGIRSNNDYLVRNSNSHPSDNNALLQRGGDDSYHPVHVHPSQSWQPPIQSHYDDDDDQEMLTVFHQKSPRRNKASSSRRRGVAKWGPELLPYLNHLVDHVLKLPQSQDRSLILVLSLVYLDRACSVETCRTTSKAPPCPFVQPRTVHRLVLTSLLTAMRAVLGEEADASSFIVEESLGISSSQLQQMEAQFRRALGDLGSYVDPLQLRQWMIHWQDKFAKRVCKA